MNLELLISKYLDGDLTPEEDQLLRKIISEQPLAREEFEGSALLHVEMQQDAETIIPPADLVSQTEDLIMMKILNHSIQDSGRPTQFLKMSLRRRVVNIFSVAVMLFAFTIPFRDGAIGEFADGGNSFKNVNSGLTEIDLGLLKALAQDEADVLKSSGKFRKAGNSFKNTGGIALKNDSEIISTDDNRLTTAPVELENAGMPEVEIADNNSIMESVLAFPSLASNRSSVADRNVNLNTGFANEAQYNMPGKKGEKDEVQVSTFLATNVFKNSDKEKAAIASFSQSVSYGLSQNDRVGVELGYSSYLYEGNVTVSVSSPKGFIVSKIMGAGEDTAPPIPVDGSDKRTSHDLVWHDEQVAVTEQVKMYWGAAFYERQLLKLGNGSLHSRVGAGGSGEGGIAYGRVFGRYNLLSAISLTMGAESRAMVKAPVSVGKPEVNASLSIMYGLQVRF